MLSWPIRFMRSRSDVPLAAASRSDSTALLVFAVALSRGAAVGGGLFAVLGGLDAVGLGLEPVQGCLGALLGGGVTTGGSSIPGIDQVRSVTSAGITISAAPGSIDAGVTTVASSILHRHGAGRPVPLLSSQVTVPGRLIPTIRSDIPRHRFVQDVVDLGVPLGAAPVPFVGDDISLVGQAVPTVGRGVALVSHPVPLVSRPFPLAQPTLLLIHPCLVTLARARPSAR
jgi:hypothetical protein